MIGIQSADVKVGVGSAGRREWDEGGEGEIFANVYFTFIACVHYLLLVKMSTRV